MAFPEDNKSASISKVIVSGGGSRSNLWRQILSDIFQLPVYTALCGVPSEGGTCKHWNNIEQSAVRVGKDRREISHK